MTAITNLLTNIPAELPEELSTTVLDRAGFRIERIVSRGQVSPPGFWYDQERHEWVLLLKGAAQLRFEDEARPVDLRPGDGLTIAAHRRHRVEWTAPDEPTIWLAVFHD